MEENEYKLRMAVISGASHALQYKRENPKSDDDEILQKVMSNANEILSKIDTSED